ncbi:VOC family protein [Pseudonocardia broussonetiae]|uniref:VOC family protein n=1 Tax=Pseudonocardia broussonetiae TaxID=2736640 RepID=A0A6M6JC48_9PSEU|nr:VOC family protein [Pseudonocardia broussonetiae]QJY44663.1 VOC family protein [Pseudonocardia broussonetiae]
MEILSSRVLLRPADHDVTLAFYRDVLGLAIAREFPGGTVFFAGNGFVEVSGAREPGERTGVALWLQVRDLDAAAAELAAHVVREPRTEPWGLREMWLADPDGVRIVLVEVPPDHPIRRDVRHE